MIEERAVVFESRGCLLPAVLSIPSRVGRRAVVVVVGGPQYRVGSHRQFTSLCRMLAEEGVAAMRFDYRGMGDAEGEMQSFEDAPADIGAAVDEVVRQLPSVREVVLWGLCDGASAASFYAQADRRVRGLVLLNPWVRDAASYAKTSLKHYYTSRITDADFWRKVLRGEFSVGNAARSFARTLRDAAPGRRAHDKDWADGSGAGPTKPLAERMRRALERFDGRVLLILSGRDLTAREFADVSKSSADWRRLVVASRVEQRDLPEADHTFSRRIWNEQVARWTAEWVRAS